MRVAMITINFYDEMLMNKVSKQIDAAKEIQEKQKKKAQKSDM